MGFRDSNQDLLGFVHMVPERARERILDLAATQLPTGGAYHQYQPLTKRGNDDVGRGFNDDPLWLVLGVAAYIKETGDWTILDEPVPYDNQPGQRDAALRAPAALASHYTLERLGPHGLPLIGRADWNDCLNLNCFSETPGNPSRPRPTRTASVAESVFIAGLFVLAAKELAAIAERIGRRRRGRATTARPRRRWKPRSTRTAGTARGSGAPTTDFGQPVGSQRMRRRPDLHRAAGHVRHGRHRAGRTARRRAGAGLGAPSGSPPRTASCCSSRPSRSYYLHLGEISSYPPGYKENAGIFCHTNPWIMIAETMVGQRRPRARLLPAHQPFGARGASASCTAASRTSTPR